MTIFTHCLAGFAGFVLCWFTKDTIHEVVVGTEAFVKNLEAKAKAIKTAVAMKAK